MITSDPGSESRAEPPNTAHAELAIRSGQLDRLRAGYLLASEGRSHVPLRPLWLCRSCTAAWPCPIARDRLPVEYHADPVGLHLYLAVALQAAIEDLYLLNSDPGPDPAIMYARFLAWARPRLLITRARLGVDTSGNWWLPRGEPPSQER